MKAVAQKGVVQALRDDPALAGGVFLYQGEMVHQALGEHFGIASTPLDDLLGEEAEA
jgi:alanine dehydrogenase